MCRIGKVDTIFKLLEQHFDGGGGLPQAAFMRLAFLSFMAIVTCLSRLCTQVSNHLQARATGDTGQTGSR